MLFLQRGYTGTTMTAVGAAAGVRSNVVHWYFDTKDQLFIQVLDDLQLAFLQDLSSSALAEGGRLTSVEIEELMLGLVAGTRPAAPLISSLHERAAESAEVEQFHRRAHARYGQLLEQMLRRTHASPESIPFAVDALTRLLESLAMHEGDPAEDEQLIRFVVPRFLEGSTR